MKSVNNNNNDRALSREGSQKVKRVSSFAQAEVLIKRRRSVNSRNNSIKNKSGLQEESPGVWVKPIVRPSSVIRSRTNSLSVSRSNSISHNNNSRAPFAKI